MLLVLLLACSAATPAWAWSKLGHQLVGELAQRHLRPDVEARVRALLAGEPDPTLAGVAYWADALRSDDPPRFKATSRWHYVNAKGGGCGFDPARDCADGGCVISAIEAQRAILADDSQPREARRDALKFLVHLVGDVHQPLHAGDRPDSGGNGFQVSLATQLPPEPYVRDKYVRGVMGTNLHSVWDFYLLGESRLDRRVPPLQRVVFRVADDRRVFPMIGEIRALDLRRERGELVAASDQRRIGTPARHIAHPRTQRRHNFWPRAGSDSGHRTPEWSVGCGLLQPTLHSAVGDRGGRVSGWGTQGG